jgi:phosphate transport system permease protein
VEGKPQGPGRRRDLEVSGKASFHTMPSPPSAESLRLPQQEAETAAREPARGGSGVAALGVGSAGQIGARLRRQDIAFRLVTQSFAFGVLLVLAGIIVSLVVGSWPSITRFGAGFFFNSAWNPVTEEFGALVPIIGTLVTSAIALAIGVPVSFGIALFLTELSPPWLRRPIGVAIELLAAIPSIIYGMWGLFVFAPLLAEHVQPVLIKVLGPIPLIGALFQGPPMGIGVLTAGIILAIMVIPFISAVMRDVFDIVPGVLKESAYAVGSTTWEVVWNIVLPYTKVGVIGGIMLGLGRALGETMAVTFVIGNAHRLSTSLLAPGNSIASALANEFTEAVGDLYFSALIQLGLILFVITLIVLSLSKLLLMRLARQEGRQT